MKYLVTGVAGFIGSTLAELLLAEGHEVRGIDCFTDYYPRVLKEGNLERARSYSGFEMIESDIMDEPCASILDGVEVIVHLAAQAGVRKSWGENFQIYTHNNIMTTQKFLEAMKEMPVKRMVYASSSSVYGDNKDLPSKIDATCRPVSPYGVTKLAGEHLCSLYNRNFGLDTVSLRYFTVYGPRQRPDMAFHRFIKALLMGGEIRIFGDGGQSRDFTFIEDIAMATYKASTVDEAKGMVFNIGGGHRETVNQVISMMEEMTGKTCKITRLEVAKGDVRDTQGDCHAANEVLGWRPQSDLASGLAAEAKWVEEMLPVLKDIA